MFDLVFVDPPYAKGLGEIALRKLADGGWLAPGAIAVLERSVGEPSFTVDGFQSKDVRDYGAARVHFMVFA